MRRAATAAAGAALPAAIAAAASSSSEVAECRAPSSLADSFAFISDSEIEDVANGLKTSLEQHSASAGSSLAGSSLVDIKDLGNGWVSADEPTTRSILALGKDLAADPRVQAAVMDRVNDPFKLRLGKSPDLLAELKLVLISREVAPDGSNTTPNTASPQFSRNPSAEHLDEKTAEAETARQDAGAAAGAGLGKENKQKPAEEKEGPSLGAALLEAAILVASVIIITVVAKRVNPKACAVAGAALVAAWSAIFAPFGNTPRGK
jgi:hypothetical protein